MNTEHRFSRIAGTVAMALLPFATAAASAAAAAQTPAMAMIVPDSSVLRPQDRGVRAHTNFQILLPAAMATLASRARPAALNPDTAGLPLNETPASLGCIYHLTTFHPGCLPNKVRELPSGGSKLIVIVDAYYYPTAMKDLAIFSNHFGLVPVTPANFQVVFADGHQPAQDHTGGWEGEEALDIEMAHAMAPSAKIVLMEAKSAGYLDLLAGVAAAAKLVAAAGGGEVSMSWGGTEFAAEVLYEKNFAAPGVVFLAASGDGPGTSFPSVMANVVSVGGTQVWRGSNNAVYQFQGANAFGGGPSEFVRRPAYQDGIASIVGPSRGSPDVAAYFCGNTLDYATGESALCAAGAWVFDSTPVRALGVQGWLMVAGTSVATPIVAGIVNNAGRFATSSALELTTIYTAPAADRAFADIVTYGCEIAPTLDYVPAVKGWDICTGVGAPIGLLDK
jgi:hypothetical protein